MVHPFNLDEGIDESLETFFGLNLPLLDFRIGLQGIEESFSFVINKEDENMYGKKESHQRIINLLKQVQKR